MTNSALQQATNIRESHEFLRVLASETRQRILFEVFGDGQERTVGEVAEKAEIGLSTASEYLADMRRAGVLKSRRKHKEVYYQPDQTLLLEHLQRLIHAISNCCCCHKPDLEALLERNTNIINTKAL